MNVKGGDEMKLGMSTIVFRDEPLDDRLLTKISDAGAASVELTDYHPGFDYCDLETTSILRAKLKDLGLELNSFHVHLKYFDPKCDLAAAGLDQRTHVIKRYREAIEALSGLGGCILVTHDNLIPNADEAGHEEARVSLVRNLTEIAALGADHGIRIAVENHGAGYFGSPEHLVDLVRSVGADNVGICIDVGHRNLCGHPGGALRIAGEHLITVHIHDNHGDSDEHLLPTRGAIDWNDVFDALQQIDFPGTFMYEIPRPEDLADVKDNFKLLLQDSIR